MSDRDRVPFFIWRHRTFAVDSLVAASAPLELRRVAISFLDFTPKGSKIRVQDRSDGSFLSSKWKDSSDEATTLLAQVEDGCLVFQSIVGVLHSTSWLALWRGVTLSDTPFVLDRLRRERDQLQRRRKWSEVDETTHLIRLLEEALRINR